MLFMTQCSYPLKFFSASSEPWSISKVLVYVNLGSNNNFKSETLHHLQWWLVIVTFSTSVSSSNVFSLSLTSAKILLSNLYGPGPTTRYESRSSFCRILLSHYSIGLKVLSQSLYIRVEMLYILLRRAILVSNLCRVCIGLTQHHH